MLISKIFTLTKFNKWTFVRRLLPIFSQGFAKEETPSEFRFSLLQGNDPSISDMLLTDLTEKMLYDEIAKKLGVSYLADSQQSSVQEVAGIIIGKNERLMVPLIVEIKKKRKIVIFLVDTGAPDTYLSRNVLDSMGYEIGDTEVSGKINGIHHMMQISPKLVNNVESHLHEVNLLGGVFLRQCEAKLMVDYGLKNFKLVFPSLSI